MQLLRLSHSYLQSNLLRASRVEEHRILCWKIWMGIVFRCGM